MHGPHASNATELAFQALGAHSTVFTPKHRETEGVGETGREGGRHGSTAGVQ